MRLLSFVASFASRIGTDVQTSRKVQTTVRGRRVLMMGAVFGEVLQSEECLIAWQAR